MTNEKQKNPTSAELSKELRSRGGVSRGSQEDRQLRHQMFATRLAEERGRRGEKNASPEGY
jgi:hypothetical protein